MTEPKLNAIRADLEESFPGVVFEVAPFSGEGGGFIVRWHGGFLYAHVVEDVVEKHHPVHITRRGEWELGDEADEVGYYVVFPDD